LARKIKMIAVAPETEEVVEVEITHRSAHAPGALDLAVAEIVPGPKAWDERRSCRASRPRPWRVRLKPSAHAKSLAGGLVPRASESWPLPLALPVLMALSPVLAVVIQRSTAPVILSNPPSVVSPPAISSMDLAPSLVAEADLPAKAEAALETSSLAAS
jgi:hypothetical protein